MAVQIRKPNYQKDKRGWLKMANGKKVKLRKYISEIARTICKINKHDYKTNREYIIKAYNKGGLEFVKAWVNKQFNEHTKKDEKIS